MLPFKIEVLLILKKASNLPYYQCVERRNFCRLYKYTPFMKSTHGRMIDFLFFHWNITHNGKLYKLDWCFTISKLSNHMTEGYGQDLPIKYFHRHMSFRKDISNIPWALSICAKVWQNKNYNNPLYLIYVYDVKRISVQITFEIKGSIFKRKSPFHGTLVVRLWF